MQSNRKRHHRRRSPQKRSESDSISTIGPTKQSRHNAPVVVVEDILPLMRAIMRDLGHNDFTGDRNDPVQCSKYYLPTATAPIFPAGSTSPRGARRDNNNRIGSDTNKSDGSHHHDAAKKRHPPPPPPPPLAGRSHNSGIIPPTLDHMATALSAIVFTPQWTIESSIRLAQPTWRRYVNMVSSQLVLRPVMVMKGRHPTHNITLAETNGAGKVGCASIDRRAEVVDVIRTFRWMLRQFLRRWCAMMHILTALMDAQHRDHQLAMLLLPKSAPHLCGKRLVGLFDDEPHHLNGADNATSSPSSFSTPIAPETMELIRRRILMRIDKEFRAIQCVSQAFPKYGGEVACGGGIDIVSLLLKKRRAQQQTGGGSTKKDMLLSQSNTTPSPSFIRMVHYAYRLWVTYAVASGGVMKRLMPPHVTAAPSHRQLQRWASKAMKKRSKTNNERRHEIRQVGDANSATDTVAVPATPPASPTPPTLTADRKGRRFTLASFVGFLIPTPLSRADLRRSISGATLNHHHHAIDEFRNGLDARDAHVRRLLAFTHGASEYQPELEAFMSTHLHSSATARQELDEERDASLKLKVLKKGAALQVPLATAAPNGGIGASEASEATLRHLLETVALWRFQQLLVLRWAPMLLFGGNHGPVGAPFISPPDDNLQTTTPLGTIRDGDLSCLFALASWCCEDRLVPIALPLRTSTNASVVEFESKAFVAPPLLPLLKLSLKAKRL
ncbi:Hypothetical protein, putative [Bodo saltans]|uniref:Uncharacterized protein n=1 Tax=Bodo saltans TaxID=75058 RepID=A0A0S4IQZ1_BODSA|nr:Hypothetical protein, putative [Bodo saltans]|eukprot:CUF31445.1 Hypothetical protein, putative [Bodo saltans]